MKKNHVWIVEMKNGDRWVPTVGCGLTQKDGEWHIAVWRRNNPDGKFRLKQYRPASLS
jgi:hypothetical protein